MRILVLKSVLTAQYQMEKVAKIRMSQAALHLSIIQIQKSASIVIALDKFGLILCVTLASYLQISLRLIQMQQDVNPLMKMMQQQQRRLNRIHLLFLVELFLF